MAYGVGIVSVLPTELVARLILSEKSVVGLYSATSHRPGPAIPATDETVSSTARLSLVSGSAGALAFDLRDAMALARKLHSGCKIRENLDAFRKAAEFRYRNASGADSIEYIHSLRDFILVIVVQRADRRSWQRSRGRRNDAFAVH